MFAAEVETRLGIALTVILTVLVKEPGQKFVPVTEYVLVAAGHTITLFPAVELISVGGAQV